MEKQVRGDVKIALINAKDAHCQPCTVRCDYNFTIENKGFTKNWNEVITDFWNEKFDALCLSNNDIDIPKNYIQTLVSVLDEHPNVGIFTSSFNSPHIFLRNAQGVGIREVPFVEFTAPVIRMDMIREIGLFDETFSKGWGVDIDYCMRIRHNGKWTCAVTDATVFHHYEHQNMMDQSQYFVSAYKELSLGLKAKYGQTWKTKLMQPYPNYSLCL